MITPKYVLFWGHTNADLKRINESCFSQWFPSNIPIAPEQFPGFQIPDGITSVPTAEHFMMAKKCHVHNDLAGFMGIFKTKDPLEVKKIGRSIKNYDDRKWSQVRYMCVVEGNINKFKNNPALKEFLLSTGDKILVEASPFDKVWGIGLGPDDPDARDETKWKGQNLLGKALMEVREILRNE